MYSGTALLRVLASHRRASSLSILKFPCPIVKPLLSALCKVNEGKRVICCISAAVCSLVLSSLCRSASKQSFRSLFYASQGPHCSPLHPLQSIPVFLHSQTFSRTFTSDYSRWICSCVLWFVRLFMHPSMMCAFICFAIA